MICSVLYKSISQSINGCFARDSASVATESPSLKQSAETEANLADSDTAVCYQNSSMFVVAAWIVIVKLNDCGATTTTDSLVSCFSEMA